VKDRFLEIYENHAEWFDRLVSREDHPGALLPAVLAVCPLEGARVVEFGAGTGRVTRLVSSRARRVHAFDGSLHMLLWASQYDLPNVTLAVADNRALPVRSASADVAIEGWSFSHMTDWHPDAWRAEAGKALDEMLRVVRPGGMAVCIETLGTGCETPTPPSAVLASYYEWLERERGFTRTWCRTDYLFESLAEAEELARPFFGDAIADGIAREKLVAVPECTGVWWQRK
jgi:ubiquinone/menaquinone biosynthesis C-methylase UbiE